MGIWDLINSAKTAVNRVVEENVHNEDRRAQIVRIGTSFIKNAAVYGFQEGLRWIPGGIVVHKIVKKGLKDQPAPPNPKKNKKSEQPAVVVQEEVKEMHEKMEKMQEEMKEMHEKMEKMHEGMKTKKPLEKLPDEPAEGSAPLKTDPKKVSIRSRL